MEFKENLKRLRMQQGLTQAQLAETLFVSRSTVAKWENGLGLPNPESMAMLEKLFDIGAEALATKEPESVIVEKKRNAIVKGKKVSLIGTVVAVAVVISTAMLISCQFRFGAIVIATESMTGEINKGDMIIYERYDGQPIKEGQVIVFMSYDVRIIHRVVKIEHIGNEVRYYTKGDANEEQDQGYVTEADIVGLTDMKLSYVGYPTLWLRELLEGSN